MILDTYNKVLAVFTDRPLKLWGLSLLALLLEYIGCMLVGLIPGAALAVSFLFSTSVALIYLKGCRREKVETTMLFDTFSSWQTIKRVSLGLGWMSLWIFIWGLIPIVGIIFAVQKIYAYRFTPYILICEPEIPITEAIKESEKRTDGYKATMFWADVLPSVAITITFALLASLVQIRFVGPIFGLVLFAFVICVAAFSSMFYGLVRASFYDKLGAKPTPVIETPCGAETASTEEACFVEASETEASGTDSEEKPAAEVCEEENNQPQSDAGESAVNISLT